MVVVDNVGVGNGDLVFIFKGFLVRELIEKFYVLVDVIIVGVVDLFEVFDE